MRCGSLCRSRMEISVGFVFFWLLLLEEVEKKWPGLCANDGIIYVYILTGTNIIGSLLTKQRSHDQVQHWGWSRFLAKP